MKPKRNSRAKAKPKPPLVLDEALAPADEEAAQRPMLAELRRRAETSLAALPEQAKATPPNPQSEADTARLLHELMVHQVELELQNTELQETRDRMEASLERYADLYDFAPVGYFTLTPGGEIRQVNLAGARLLGLTRAEVVGQSFARLVAVEHRPEFQNFLKRVFASSTRQTRDFELLGKERPFRTVNLEAQYSASQGECRVVVVDITERQRAAEATAKLAAIVQSTDDAIYCKTFAGVITSWNPGAERMFGYLAPEIMGKNISVLIPPARAGESESLIAKSRRGELVTNFETERVRKNGSLLWVSLSTATLQDRTGQSTGVCVIAHDITERKQIENMVRISEVRYRRLFEAAHDGVLLLDPDTRKITDANPFMTRLLGYPNEELVGRELFEIGLLKDEVASQEMFQKLKRRHEVRYEDLPLKSQTGRQQEVEVVANLYQENGHAVIQCNIRDITDRKRAEEELRRNEALFSTLIEEAPYGVYVVNSNFRLQQVNRKARPVFRKVRPLIGRDFVAVHRRLWPRKVADAIIARFRHTLKTGEPYRSPEFTARRRDVGVTEIYEWQIQRVTMPGGEFAVVAFFNDITERKRAEEIQRRIEVLGASNRKLEKEIIRRRLVEKSLLKSERLQRRLLAESRLMQTQLRSLSHQILQAQEEERKRISRELHDDITQTLVNISVHLESLVGDANLDPRRLKRKITRTQELVERSVDSIHQFARDLRPPALDHLGLISTLHALMTEFMKRTGVRVHFTSFAGVEKLGSARRTVLYRVVQSALSNVARHAHASRVDVSIRKLRGRVCMTIQDNGKSFDPARLRYRKGSQRLGLLGMRERLEMVGGRFELKAAPGQGTTITAQVPLGRAASAGGGGDNLIEKDSEK